MMHKRFRKLFLLLLSTFLLSVILRRGNNLETLKKLPSLEELQANYIPRNLQNVKKRSIVNRCPLPSFPENVFVSPKRDWKKIVIYTPYFKANGLWGKVFQRLCNGECEESRCLLSTNQEDIDIADAVLFDGNSIDRFKYRNNEKRFVYPKRRGSDQVYVFFSTEPPTRFGEIKLYKFENFFNWTMTYRRDSDVVIPFGQVIKRTVKRKPNEIKYVTKESLNKKKMAIWLNSHCVKNSPRISFFEKLSRYIYIDVFGDCVNRKCGTRALLKKTRPVGEDSCEKSFSDYTYFMALENSLCKDYVTEKLYRSLNLSIIPVVFSGANSTDFAPPKSYIDSKDFESVADLATYLEKVASDATLYNEYLKWQEDYDVDVGTPYKPLVCDLCKKLHSFDPVRDRKTYVSIKDWWIQEAGCSPH